MGELSLEVLLDAASAASAVIDEILDEISHYHLCIQQ